MSEVREVKPKRSYMVCATPRTGSYLLCDLLKQTSVAGQPTEYFSSGYQNYWSSFWAPPSYADYLRRIVALGTGMNGVFGVKAHPRQFRYFARQESGRETTTRLQERQALDRWLPDVRYLWLRRRDVLQQGISWVRSMQTNIWWDAAEAPAPYDRPTPEALRFDFELISAAQARMRAEDRMWAEYFEVNEISPFVLWYEDLAADRYGCLRRVLDALGLFEEAGAQTPTPTLRRQGDIVTERWAQRYPALRGARVEGTWSAVEGLEAGRPDIVVTTGSFERPPNWDEARHSLLVFGAYQGSFKPDYAVTDDGIAGAELNFTSPQSSSQVERSIRLPTSSNCADPNIAIGVATHLGADRIALLDRTKSGPGTESVSGARVLAISDSPGGLDLTGFLMLPARPQHERLGAPELNVAVCVSGDEAGWVASLVQCIVALTRHRCAVVRSPDTTAVRRADVVIVVDHDRVFDMKTREAPTDRWVSVCTADELTSDPLQLSLQASNGRQFHVPVPLDWWTANNRPHEHTGEPLVAIVSGAGGLAFEELNIDAIRSALSGLAEVVEGDVSSHRFPDVIVDLSSDEPTAASLIGLSRGAVVINRMAALPGERRNLQWVGAPFICADPGDVGWIIQTLLRAPGRRAELGAAGRAWIEQHYNFSTQWDQFWVPLLAEIHALAQANQSPTAHPTEPAPMTGAR
jgi:LPS sulfotransferase NodH